MPTKKNWPAMIHKIDGKDYVTVSEVARLQGVSRQAVWVKIQRGTLAHIRAGARLYVPLAALKDA